MAAPNKQDKLLASNDTPTDASASRPQGKQDMFEDALRQEGVSGQLADIARSIYQQESSGGRNTKTSNANASGGMQIIPSTFNSVADPGWDIHDNSQNARAGIRYLKDLYGKAGGDARLTAAGYYGGPAAITKARQGLAVSDPRNPKAPNTLQYADQVLDRLGTSAGTPATSSAMQSQSSPQSLSPSDSPFGGSGKRPQPTTPPRRSDGGAAYCQSLIDAALSAEIPPPVASVVSAATNLPPPAKDRDFGDVVTDTGKALAGGVNGLISGVGELYGLFSGNTDNSVTRFGKSGQEYGENQESDALKQMKRERDAKIAAADGELNKFGTAAWETISSPSLLLDTVANNAATFVPGAALGKAAQAYKLSRALTAATEAGEISVKAASTIAKAGNAAEGLEAAVKAGEISPALARTISTQAGKYAVVGGKVGGAVQQAADVSYSRYEDDMKKTDAEMMQNPDYVALKQQLGGTPEAGRQAQHELALKAARAAFLPAAGISYAANSIVPGAGAADRALLGVAQKNAQRGFLKTAARDIAGEATTEILEEGGGRLAANAMSRHFVDPNQSLTDGVGENAGMGAAGGFGFGLTGSVKHALTGHAQHPQQAQQSQGALSSSPDAMAVSPPVATPSQSGMGSLSRAATAGQQASAASAMPGANAVANTAMNSSTTASTSAPVNAAANTAANTLTGTQSTASTAMPAGAQVHPQDASPAARLLSQDGQATIITPSAPTTLQPSGDTGVQQGGTTNIAPDMTADTAARSWQTEAAAHTATQAGPAEESAGLATQQKNTAPSADARFAHIDAAIANNTTLRGRTLVSPDGKPIKLSPAELTHYRQALATTSGTGSEAADNTTASTAASTGKNTATAATTNQITSSPGQALNTPGSQEHQGQQRQAADMPPQSRISLHGLDIALAQPNEAGRADRSIVDGSGSYVGNAGNAGNPPTRGASPSRQQGRYLTGTVAASNTHIGTLIGPHHASGKVFVADQMHPGSGQFAQHKIMLGFNTAGQARAAYNAHQNQISQISQTNQQTPGRKMRSDFTETTAAHIKNWLTTGNTSQPFSQQPTPRKLAGVQSVKASRPQAAIQAEEKAGNAGATSSQDSNSGNNPDTKPGMAGNQTAKSLDGLGRPLSHILVNTHLTDRDSGAESHKTMPASEALSSLDSKLDILKKLISCLHG